VTLARVLVHKSVQPIRWSDMDMLGHVNNVVYFRYMEQARIEWLYALAGDRGYRGGEGPVIVNASCNFRVPLVYPGTVEVRMWLGDPGRTSVGSFYELWKDGKSYADGAAKIVWIDTATGRPQPLPDAIVAPLRAAVT
jgi:acyl-CoA thioester hydrolase